ncbi:MAG: class I SAM-dependent methyltransferase [Pseudomonadales bacterium]|nr:class I SAM-dependent methyltransferase [Pseudomonadales bacterium]
MDENPVDDSQIAFDLQILNSSHSDIKKLKRQHPTSIHGNKFWGSSFLIIDYFRRNPPQEKLKVLELGCGWALAGIYLNKNFSSKVDCLDADEDVFPYAQLHADINQASIHTQQKRFEKITKSELGEYDLIIAADVCFWDELSDIHFNLIRRALQAGVKKIVYADPERAPFTLLAQRCEEKLQSEGIRIQCIDARVKSLKASGKLLIIEQQ